MIIGTRVVTSLRDIIDLLEEVERKYDFEMEDIESEREERNKMEEDIFILESNLEEAMYTIGELEEKNSDLKDEIEKLYTKLDDVIMGVKKVMNDE